MGKTIVLEGIEYDLVPRLKGNLRIIVADRGFVYIGNVTENDKGITITNARNIRRYGTIRGLGQLALEGRQTDTILDDVGTVEIPLHAIMHVIACESSKW